MDMLSDDTIYCFNAWTAAGHGVVLLNFIIYQVMKYRKILIQ